MREDNNIGFIRIHQSAIEHLPFSEDFEQPVQNWFHIAQYGTDLWTQGQPTGNVIRPFSGTQGFTTNLNTNLDTASYCQLFTPEFNLTELQHPILEFNIDLDDSPRTYDRFIYFTNLHYSIDGGYSWHVLDTTNSSYHTWYFQNTFYAYPLDGPAAITPYRSTSFHDSLENTFPSRFYITDLRNNRYEKMILDISSLAGSSRIMFRFDFTTNYYSGKEGVLIDDFSIVEPFTDLTVGYPLNLDLSIHARSFPLDITITNAGNFEAGNSLTHFYLSTDSLIDSGDNLIGTLNTIGLQPLTSTEFFTTFSLGSNDSAGNYNYLIYDLDYNNIINESNEQNNTGYFRLNTNQPIITLPYTSDFLPAHVDGWKWYNDQTGSEPYTRFMNNAYNSYYRFDRPDTGFFSTHYDFLTNYANYPRLFLESPAFNFSGIDSIFIKFDFMSTGEYVSGLRDGSNFQFSSDGGINWQILTANMGTVANWYNSPTMERLDNEPGWTGARTTYANASIGTPVLAGMNDCIFRYKYRSNWLWSTVEFQGFALNNFHVEGFSADYRADDHFPVINATLLNNAVNVPVKISNQGQTNGRTCKLNFYWSTDTIFDASDGIFYQAYIAPVPNNSTVTTNYNLPFVLPVLQFDYYVFCKIDATDTIQETDEFNNLNSYHLIFDQLSNIKESTNETPTFSIVENAALLQFEQPQTNQVFHFEMLSTEGKIISEANVTLRGNTTARWNFPKDIASGLYIINVFYDGHKSSLKYIKNKIE
ncbi:hypothetical protein BH09BAC5_BH09BAC5_06580 [soil metagenome]